jgi:prepilin-type N-terminal cleavage/methylation domain-containing protein
MNGRRNEERRAGRKRQGGFTLIELLVVIAVLAILAAVVVLNLLGVDKSATSTACKTDLQTVQSAADAYRNDTGSYATSLGDLHPTYLHTVPGSVGTVNLNSDGRGTVTSSDCS